MGERDVVVPPERVLKLVAGGPSVSMPTIASRERKRDDVITHSPALALLLLLLEPGERIGGRELIPCVLGLLDIALDARHRVLRDRQEVEVDLARMRSARHPSLNDRQSRALTHRSSRIALDPLSDHLPRPPKPRLRRPLRDSAMLPRVRLEPIELVQLAHDGRIRDKVVRLLLIRLRAERRVDREGVGAGERVVGLAELFRVGDDLAERLDGERQ